MHIAINAIVNLVLTEGVVVNGFWGTSPAALYRSNNDVSVVGMIFPHFH